MAVVVVRAANAVVVAVDVMKTAIRIRRIRDRRAEDTEAGTPDPALTSGKCGAASR
jgi:hypothetical protein